MGLRFGPEGVTCGDGLRGSLHVVLGAMKPDRPRRVEERPARSRVAVLWLSSRPIVDDPDWTHCLVVRLKYVAADDHVRVRTSGDPVESRQVGVDVGEEGEAHDDRLDPQVT